MTCSWADVPKPFLLVAQWADAKTYAQLCCHEKDQQLRDSVKSYKTENSYESAG